MKTILINFLLKILFYPAPSFKITIEEELHFEKLFQMACESDVKHIQFDSPLHKYKFLSYITHNKPILLHGSNNLQIQTFEPREQTLFNGTMDKAVFATKDPIWPCFYAILNKGKIVGDIRNGCITANGMQKYHLYSITKQTGMKQPFTNGMIYFLPDKSFQYIGDGIIQFDEWISREAVRPLAKLEVEPSDFYYLHRIAYHNEKESLSKTWLLYKMRTKWMTKKQKADYFNK